jgi:hypothetical protein
MQIADRRTNGLAVASFITGFFGFVGITALLSIIFGLVALGQISHSGGHYKGRGWATFGILFSLAWIAAGAAVYVHYFAHR